jgi:chromosome segregation ATPase
MKIKEVENKLTDLIENLRKTRDELSELKDKVADSEIECKTCINEDLKYAHESLMGSISILERTISNYERELEYKEERDAMKTLRVYPEERRIY